MNQIIECVPNFSEGRNQDVINEISEAISNTKGVHLLNVDPGQATNRTVMTFVGDPGSVISAAFNAIKTASEKIDMSKHTGEHPRFGATDVCPLIPVSNITFDELIPYAEKLAKKVSEELNIPIYLYEHAAREDKRRNLATIRSGEYEGLNKKINSNEWKPDFGSVFNKKSGATAIGVRDFLIAYNINLNTKSTRLANAIAFDVREKGRIKRNGHPVIGEIVYGKDGKPENIPGSLKHVKAIGWYIEEFGIAQISMNLTNITETPIHNVFEEVVNKANERGASVTGSELVGLIPLKSMIDAGKYFLKKQNRSLGIPEEDIIKIAIESLGLNQVKEFDPNKNIIEYYLDKITNKNGKLVDLSSRNFSDEVSRETPAPGGGSVSSYVGALGTSLAGMVANLSCNTRGWENKVEIFSDKAYKINHVREKLISLVDEDAHSFNSIMEAYKLPKDSEENKQVRSEAIKDATLHAAQIPLNIMIESHKSYEIIEFLAKEGNQSSLSDSGVACLCVHTAIHGAFLNVRINLKDASDGEEIMKKADEILKSSYLKKEKIMKLVEDKL
ncbi:MAG: glutamate formimidoyltransferase [Cytophagales bacterium]